MHHVDPVADSAAAGAQLSTVCAECGLCCDGTFFARVRLGPGEDAVLRARGLRVLEGVEESLSQPCPAHTGSGCRVYEDRPAKCAGFDCGVLRDVADGTMSVESAVERVTAMRALARKIRSSVPEGTTVETLVSTASRLLERDDGLTWRRQHAEVLMDLAVFLRQCRQEFRLGDAI